MRIGILSTRLAGTDGVSLEVEKWVRVLAGMGHEIFYCAGELDGYAAGGTLIPEMHFAHPKILALSRRAFEDADRTDPAPLLDQIHQLAEQLRKPLRDFIRTHALDLIIVQNALAIPMNLPLGVCLAELIQELDIPAIAHGHDFYWERERYQSNRILDLLDRAFPPSLPSLQHVTINTIARDRLQDRRHIESTIIPNVFDFSRPPGGVDAYSRDLRQALGLQAQAPLILQPTRVIRRKGIELAITLVKRLSLAQPDLFIPHSASDEGLNYWHWLEREARLMGVRLHLIDQLVSTSRLKRGGRKMYSLWDIYPHADLVTYPSLYEGFGNALLEAVYFRLPVVVNRYPVYNADIKPLGFEFIELDGFVDDHSVSAVQDLLADPQDSREVLDQNYNIAREHFSLEVLESKLRTVLGSF